jgi:hypothetical protein
LNVILEDSLFRLPFSSASLVALFQLGFEGRHRIQADPAWTADGDSQLNSWIAGQERDLREELELTLEIGTLVEVSSGIPSETMIKVGPSGLSLDAALAILRQPFVVLVEDFENDWLFVKLLAGPKWRSYLEKWEASGWIKVQHGGGGRLLPQLAKLHPLRAWVVFDSDARAPGQPDPNAEKISAKCRELQIGHHMLRRRAAENYLPLEALELWTRKIRKDRRMAFVVFADFSFDQRCHFAMREGFKKKGDRKVDPKAEFFGDYANHPFLMKGFGTEVRDLFREEERFKIEEIWLTKDDKHGEHSDIYLGLLRRL